MNFYRAVKWIARSESFRRHGVQVTREFLNSWLSLSRHYIGSATWAFELTVFGMEFCNFERIRWLESASSKSRLVLRFGRYFVTIRRPLENRFRHVDLLPAASH